MWPLGWRWKEVGQKERLCLRVSAPISAPFVKRKAGCFFPLKRGLDIKDWRRNRVKRYRVDPSNKNLPQVLRKLVHNHFLLPVCLGLLWIPKQNHRFQIGTEYMGQAPGLPGRLGDGLAAKRYRPIVRIFFGVFPDVKSSKIAPFTRWWQLKYFYFHPDPWGFMIQFDLRIFFKWVGWNHQPFTL